MIEFESVEKAIETYESAGYQEAVKLLGRAVEREVRIVEGVALVGRGREPREPAHLTRSRHSQLRLFRHPCQLPRRRPDPFWQGSVWFGARLAGS